MASPDISVVITAHDEGMLAHPTLGSLERCVRDADSRGLSVEIVAVLDRARPLTREILEGFAARVPGTTVLESDFGDPGLARLRGANEASGTWMALLDGDDLFCSDWLSRAHASATADSRSVVWHPECNLYFGIDPRIFLHPDMDDVGFDLAGLAHSNYWTSLCFVKRELFLAIPHPATDIGGQRGYEDWTWNMDVIASGAIHKIVPGTAHAIRTKSVSVLQRSNSARCMPTPTRLFLDVLTKRSSVQRAGAQEPQDARSADPDARRTVA